MNKSMDQREGQVVPRVAVVMGSKSDYEVMKETVRVLAEFGVACEARVISAHRTPDRAHTFAVGAEERGIKVVIAAADPFMYSSQNEQDSRYYAKLSGLPMLEPSSVTEAKEMTQYAFHLSQELQLPVILRTTTRINHASGVVTWGPIRERVTKGSFIKNPFSYVCIPAVSRNLHPRLLDKGAQARALAEQSPWNRIDGRGAWGIVCNGVSDGYVSDTLQELGVADCFRVWRVGFSHPIPEALARQFLEGCEKVLVVEEGEPYLEEAVRNCAQKAGLTLPVQGKAEGLFIRLFEFDPAMVKRVIAAYFQLPGADDRPIRTDDLPEAPLR